MNSDDIKYSELGQSVRLVAAWLVFFCFVPIFWDAVKTANWGGLIGAWLLMQFLVSQV